MSTAKQEVNLLASQQSVVVTVAKMIIRHYIIDSTIKKLLQGRTIK